MIGSEWLLAADPRLHVLALVLYGIATGAGIYANLAGRLRVETISRSAAGVALVVHGAGLIVRWMGSGHGPYLTRYELLSAYAWVSVLLWIVWSFRDHRVRSLGAVVLPTALLLIGIGLYTGPEVQMLPPTFKGVWLALHVSFYFVAFATGLTTFGASLMLIVRSVGARLAWAPQSVDLDALAYRAAGMAFAFWGMGLLTGSIWAYYSWGRFWAWDPVETWSLITWLCFGIYLHLRRFYRWSGTKAAVLVVLCYLLALFSLFGTSLLGGTIHSEYFQ